MRKINNFFKKGGVIVFIADSVTGIGSKASWSDPAIKLWVKATYVETLEGERSPTLGRAEEVWILEPCDEKPKPLDGWCYALGFYG